MTEAKPQLAPRQVMDPEGTLPNVVLTPDPDKRQAKGTLVPEELLIVADGHTVGNATLTHDTPRKEAWFNGITLYEKDAAGEKLKGRGYGMAAYLSAIESAHERGETFRTHDWSQTDAAVKVWTKFIDAGIAIVEVPFTAYQKDAGDASEQLHTGHVRIPPIT